MRLFSLLTIIVAVCNRASATFPVKTSSGQFYGIVNPSSLNVHQYLGIPFAYPPTQHRRFLPPQSLKSSSTFNATSIGPACPQLFTANSTTPSVYSAIGGNQTEFFPIDDFSEDCLTLNIWTPASTAVSNESLPVIVWFFGGGFDGGGTNSAYFNPQSWISRTSSHLVVTVNFRSNIFGFPNAVGLSSLNLGIMDQRLGLEWVRSNIAAFGGNPNKIVAWGQSGGAIAIDYLQFAYPSDPIFSAMILDSGSAFYSRARAQTTDTTQKNFTLVANFLNCSSNATSLSEIDCMRTKSWQAINYAVGKLGVTKSFVTVPDGKLVFPDYAPRYALNALSDIPAIIGSNLDEELIYPGRVSGVVFNTTAERLKTNATFLCTAAKTSQFRQATNSSLSSKSTHSHPRKTFRYVYTGNFANIAPPPVFSGAYHASELPLIFGTSGKFHGANTPYEEIVSHNMQDLWLAFANDPLHGLEKAGWRSYAEGKAVLLGDAGDEEVDGLREVGIEVVDGACNSISVP